MASMSLNLPILSISCSMMNVGSQLREEFRRLLIFYVFTLSRVYLVFYHMAQADDRENRNCQKVEMFIE